jgi:4-hydroxyphenylacetate 3-monooxygenase
MSTADLTLDATSEPFVLRDADREASLALRRPQLLVAGYTGRNASAVDAHIAELAAHGVPAPEHVPSFYPVGPELLVLAPTVLQPSGSSTSGEAEPVLIRAGGELFVGVGSDHTDREVEKTSIPASKLACPKVLGTDVWPLASVIDDWDELRLASTVGADAQRYQDGSVAELRRPEEVLELAAPWIEDPEGDLVLFLGTVPLLDGKFLFTDVFRAQLTDPRRGRELGCAYRINQQEIA